MAGCTLGFTFTPPDAAIDDAGLHDAGVDASSDAGTVDGGPPDASLHLVEIPTCPLEPASPPGTALLEEQLEVSARMTADLRAIGTTEGSITSALLTHLDDDHDLDIVLIDRGGLPPGTYEAHPVPSLALRSERAGGCDWGLVDESAERMPTGEPYRFATGATQALPISLYGQGVDLVVPALWSRGEVYRTSSDRRRWVSAAWPVPERGHIQGSGAAGGDLNGDGSPEVFVPWTYIGDDGASTFYRSTFEDGRRQWVREPLAFSVAHAWIADFDGDAELELLTTPVLWNTVSWPADRTPVRAILWHWVSGRMEPDTSLGGLEHIAVGGHLAVGDVDTDGDLDLVQIHRPFDQATQTHADRVVLDWLENDESRSFVRRELMSSISSWAVADDLATAVTDVDLDGYPDVLVAGNELVVLRSTRVVDLDAIAFVMADHLPTGAAGAMFGDADLDGDVDVLVAGAAYPDTHEGRMGARLYLGTATRASIRVAPELAPGVPAYGAEVCVYRAGALPEPGAPCRGALLGYGQIIASTSHGMAPELIVATRDAERVDVRVRWSPRDGGARDETDYRGLLPRHAYALRPAR